MLRLLSALPGISSSFCLHEKIEHVRQGITRVLTALFIDIVYGFVEVLIQRRANAPLSDVSSFQI